MVSVRKSHQMSQTSFDQWLTSLDINQVKSQTIESLWLQGKAHFQRYPECQTKSLEMVEILASLNMDKDSLSAAFLIPLMECGCLSLNDIHENHSNEIYLLCKGVEQMDAIKALQQNQSDRKSVV